MPDETDDPTEPIGRLDDSSRPGDPLDLPSADSESTQSDAGQSLGSELTWKERYVEALELVLVIAIVFGRSIFDSIYPLLKGASIAVSFNTDAHFLWLLQFAAGVVFLIYVISPTAFWRSYPTAKLAADGNPCPSPRSFVGIAIDFLRPRIPGIFLAALVVCGPYLLYWTTDWLPGVGYSAAFRQNIRHVNHTLSSVVSLGVVGYVLYRRGCSYRDIGMRWNRTAVALVFPLFLIGELLHAVQSPLIYWLGVVLTHPGWKPPDIANLLFGREVQFFAVPDGVANGFFEELIVRAYLMTVVIRLTGKPWLAVLLSVAVQTSYHFYQGVPAALSHIPLFTIYAAFFALTRSILPVALAHTLFDLTSLWYHSFANALS